MSCWSTTKLGAPNNIISEYGMADFIHGSRYAAAATLVGTFGVKAVLYVVNVYTLNKKRSRAISDLATRKEQWRQSIASRQLSDSEVERITNLGISELVAELKSRKLTATLVLFAYQQKALIQNERLNFICEPIREAEAQAEYLDSLSDEERLAMPLFGVPISVKENYELKGYNVNVGCAKRLGVLCKEDNAIIKMMRQKGAVPFIRTNVPQTMLAFGCCNPIYGQTRNPHDLEREPGGSSGGDGVAVSCGSALIGMGGDIGGSVRIPAAWCGVVGLKPTVNRLSFKNWCTLNPGQRAVCSTPGPIARNVDCLSLVMQALSSDEMFDEDPTIPRIPFNSEDFSSTKPLTIGFYDEYDPIATSASTKRAVKTAVRLLEAKGHEVIRWVPADSITATTYLYPSALFGDGGTALLDAVANDTITPVVRQMLFVLSIPKFLKKFLGFILKPILPAYILNFLKANMGMPDVTSWWKLRTDISTYRSVLINDWKSKGLDAVVCPAMPVPAQKIGGPAGSLAAVGYMVMFNLVDFPAGVVPITNVTHLDIQEDMESFPRKDPWHKVMKNHLVGSEGCPMAVQCVTLPHKEELCLRVMKELEFSAQYRNTPSI